MQGHRIWNASLIQLSKIEIPSGSNYTSGFLTLQHLQRCQFLKFYSKIQEPHSSRPRALGLLAATSGCSELGACACTPKSKYLRTIRTTKILLSKPPGPQPYTSYSVAISLKTRLLMRKDEGLQHLSSSRRQVEAVLLGSQGSGVAIKGGSYTSYSAMTLQAGTRAPLNPFRDSVLLEKAAKELSSLNATPNT